MGTAKAGVVDTLGTPTATYTTIGNLPTWGGTGSDTQDATFTAYIDFDANPIGGDREVIWESGAGGTGTSLIYEEDNTLRFRTRQGGGSGGTVDLSYQLTTDQITAGELFVAWVIDMGTDELRLIMDGPSGPEVVASLPYTFTDWSGGNAAGFGASTTNVGGYGDGDQFQAEPFASGTINTTLGLAFYEGDAYLPSPVPEPLGLVAGFAAFGFTILRRRRPGQ